MHYGTLYVFYHFLSAESALVFVISVLIYNGTFTKTKEMINLLIPTESQLDQENDACLVGFVATYGRLHKQPLTHSPQTFNWHFLLSETPERINIQEVDSIQQGKERG